VSPLVFYIQEILQAFLSFWSSCSQRGLAIGSFRAIVRFCLVFLGFESFFLAFLLQLFVFLGLVALLVLVKQCSS
jgi:hypothetical protein